MSYIGKINTSKYMMLFVANEVLEMEVSSRYTKEKILEIMGNIYKCCNAEDIIIGMPYGTYIALEEFIKSYKKYKDAERAWDAAQETKQGIYVSFLFEFMVIYNRVKGIECTMHVNEGVIEPLERIFTDENKKLAEEYGEYEDVIIKVLNRYGVVKFEELYEIVTELSGYDWGYQFFSDFCYKRLNLYGIIDYYEVPNTYSKIFDSGEIYFTLLDERYTSQISEELRLEEDALVYIVDSQRKMNSYYKPITREELESYDADEENKEFLSFIHNEKIYDKISFVQRVVFFLRAFRCGFDVQQKTIGYCLGDLTGKEALKLEDDINDWFNKTPRYDLCGYSKEEYDKLMGESKDDKKKDNLLNKDSENKTYKYSNNCKIINFRFRKK